MHARARTHTHTHTHTHPFNGPFYGTTRVSQYQKGKTNLDFTEARDSEWQWHQLRHMQVCTSLQTDNHTSNPPLCFLQAGCHSCRPTNSVKALKALLWPKICRKCDIGRCFAPDPAGGAHDGWGQVSYWSLKGHSTLWKKPLYRRLIVFTTIF